MTANSIIKQASLVVSAGMLFTACASHKEETSEYSSTGYSSGTTMSERSGSQATYSSQSSQSQPSYSQSQQSSSYSSSSSADSTSGQNEIVIPLHEEQFNVGKKSVSAGQVTIKKIVTTETVNQPIELRRERVIIQREGAGAQSGQVSSQSGAGASAQAGVSAGSTSAGFSAGAGTSGVSASAQAPSAQLSSTEVTTETTHQRNASVGAQLNQRAANANRTVAGNEPAGTGKSDYNSITGVPKAEDQTVTTSTTTSATLPEDKSLQTGARVSESAGAQPSYQSQGNYQSQGSYSTQSSSSAGASSQSGAAGAAFQEQTYTIQLNEEQPVIEKSVKQTGRVVARKSAEWEKQTVQRDVRREDVQVDKGNANVELRGNFNEAAGAQSSQGATSTQSQQAQPSQNIQSQPQQQQLEQPATTEPSGVEKKRNPTTRGGAEDLLQEPR